jgi:hypothetical protein
VGAACIDLLLLIMDRFAQKMSPAEVWPTTNKRILQHQHETKRAAEKAQTARRPVGRPSSATSMIQMQLNPAPIRACLGGELGSNCLEIVQGKRRIAEKNNFVPVMVVKDQPPGFLSTR